MWIQTTRRSFISPHRPAALLLCTAIALGGCGRSETAREAEQRQACATRMHILGMSMFVYAIDHQGQFPPDLGTLDENGDMSLDTFVCPASGRTAPGNPGAVSSSDNLSNEDRVRWANAHSDFTYIRPPKPTTDGGLVVLYEADADHGGRGMNVLYADGKTAFLPLDKAHQQIDAARRAAAK